jgi:hypothetical protein
VAQEGKMGKINWGRVVLCGFLTGVVWGVLCAITLPLIGRDFLATLPGSHHIPGTSLGLRGIVMISPLVLGITTMWLYAAIRPRYGPGPKTAAVAGFALWFFGSWVDAIWAALGAVPLRVLVGPVAANLPIILVAAVFGAWLYKE